MYFYILNCNMHYDCSISSSSELISVGISWWFTYQVGLYKLCSISPLFCSAPPLLIN